MATAVKKKPAKKAAKAAKGKKPAKKGPTKGGMLTKYPFWNPKTPAQYMSVDQLAEKEGVTRQSVLRWIRAKLISGVYSNSETGSMGRGFSYYINKKEYKGRPEVI